MMTTPFVTSALDFPSKRRAALRAMVVEAGSAANVVTTTNTEAAENSRRNFFMASNMKFEARKQDRRRLTGPILSGRPSGMRRTFAFGFALLLVARITSAADDFGALTKVADDFWTWRAKYAPFSSD